MRKFSILAVLALTAIALTGCKDEKKEVKVAETTEQPAAVANDTAKASDGGCPGNVKLLKSMAIGDDTRTFEYDATSRIVKITRGSHSTQTVVYDGDKVTMLRYFDGGAYDDESEDIHGESILYGEDANGLYVETKGQSFLGIYNVQGGYLNSTGNENGENTYHYQGGNLVKITGKDYEDQSTYVIEYKYDDKKSPLSNIKNSKWFLHDFFGSFTFGLNNNIIVIEHKYDDGTNDYTHTYKFEYDSDGFPTKRTTTGDGEVETVTFTYCEEK